MYNINVGRTTLSISEKEHHTSLCSELVVRGLKVNVRRWRVEKPLRVVMLHGARDSSVTFQPLVERLPADWGCAAPDWRGHGWSEHSQGPYWFHDFICDLDVMLTHLSPAMPATLVGHSLGGNVATVYAALRPDRVAEVISLDAIGLLSNQQNITSTLRRSLSLLSDVEPSRVYPDVEEMAAKLRQANWRLKPELALFLAQHASKAVEGGRSWLFDPRFKRSLPTLRTTDDWLSVWSQVLAPVLLLTSSDRRAEHPVNWSAEVHRRITAFRDLTHLEIPQTGHNLHHDAPEEVARLIEQRLTPGEL